MPCTDFNSRVRGFRRAKRLGLAGVVVGRSRHARGPRTVSYVPSQRRGSAVTTRRFFFAHLLIPHIPISMMPIATSGIRPTGSRASRRRTTASEHNAITCSDAMRSISSRCNAPTRKLGEMFERWQRAGVFQHATIIIHGDHGSRIYLHRPQASNVEEMLVSDYADAFSTLLAVKGSGLSSRVRSAMDRDSGCPSTARHSGPTSTDGARRACSPGVELGVRALRLPGKRRPGADGQAAPAELWRRRRRTAKISQL